MSGLISLTPDQFTMFQKFIYEQTGIWTLDGKTALLPGFVSARTGRSFKAFLVLKEDGKVGFEFAAREPKPGAAENGKQAPLAKPAAKSPATAKPAKPAAKRKAK